MRESDEILVKYGFKLWFITLSLGTCLLIIPQAVSDAQTMHTIAPLIWVGTLAFLLSSPFFFIGLFAIAKTIRPTTSVLHSKLRIWLIGIALVAISVFFYKQDGIPWLYLVSFSTSATLAVLFVKPYIPSR